MGLHDPIPEASDASMDEQMKFWANVFSQKIVSDIYLLNTYMNHEPQRHIPEIVRLYERVRSWLPDSDALIVSEFLADQTVNAMIEADANPERATEIMKRVEPITQWVSKRNASKHTAPQ